MKFDKRKSNNKTNKNYFIFGSMFTVNLKFKKKTNLEIKECDFKLITQGKTASKINLESKLKYNNLMGIVLFSLQNKMILPNNVKPLLEKKNKQRNSQLWSFGQKDDKSLHLPSKLQSSSSCLLALSVQKPQSSTNSSLLCFET